MLQRDIKTVHMTTMYPALVIHALLIISDGARSVITLHQQTGSSWKQIGQCSQAADIRKNETKYQIPSNVPTGSQYIHGIRKNETKYQAMYQLEANISITLEKNKAKYQGMCHLEADISMT